jgi:hypothetical protein
MHGGYSGVAAEPEAGHDRKEPGIVPPGSGPTKTLIARLTPPTPLQNTGFHIGGGQPAAGRELWLNTPPAIT